MLAVRKSTGTPVAIRYLPPQPPGRQAFHDEARLIAGLDDPGLVRLHEYVTSPHGTALISELVDGISLERIIKAEGRLAPEASLLVCKAVLLALAAAHRSGLTHGSVSPGNVLVDDEGTCKLAGLGVIAGGGTAASAGAERYRAPELAAGGPVTTAADLYSATAILYECLTGEPPVFTGGRCAGPIGPQLPQPLVSLVTTGLAADPNERPVTAPVFVSRLESVALAAYGPAWEQRGREQLSERASVLKLLFPLSRKLVSDEQARAMLNGRRRRSRGRLLIALAAALLLVVGTGAVVYASGKNARGTGEALPGVSETGPAPPVESSALPGFDAGESPAVKGGRSATGGAASIGIDRPSAGAPTGSSPSSGPAVPPGRPSSPPSPPPTPSPSPSASFEATAVEIVGLSLDETGTTATAQVKVTASGAGTVTLTVQFYADDVAHGAPETVTVTVPATGSTTVEVTHSYDACPAVYAGQASASPGSAPSHRLAAEGECA
ncbi:serine/threonine protein kinase [Thermomonospora curvata DSM 43183]|uniref:non-specific serine/threonine protein kinase n=2 Tax=Thermomonosporaceae TaxID=2012 RepID=D1AEI0_THECD|nr:serine/threonine protein kinase [Thermomonospora curvata DSM 43183]PKK16365.1 MAG: hypothetical protein BUE48_000920 [Thermomonospora sp. CIF 1]